MDKINTWTTMYLKLLTWEVNYKTIGLVYISMWTFSIMTGRGVGSKDASRNNEWKHFWNQRKYKQTTDQYLERHIISSPLFNTLTAFTVQYTTPGIILMIQRCKKTRTSLITVAWHRMLVSQLIYFCLQVTMLFNTSTFLYILYKLLQKLLITSEQVNTTDKASQ